MGSWKKKTVEAFQLLERMKEDGLKPDVVTYKTLIHGYFVDGRKMEAVQMLENMRKEGLKSSMATCRILVNGYLTDRII